MTHSKFNANRIQLRRSWWGRGLLVVLGLILAAGVVRYYGSSSRPPVEARSTNLVNAGGPVVNAQQILLDRKIGQALPSQPVRDLATTLQLEARRVGEIDKDPESSARRLNELAANLTAEQMSFLVDHSLDATVPEDERFLSAFLLSETHGQAGLQSLERLAAHPFKQQLPETEGSQGSIDWMVRAQAIEGIEVLVGKSEGESLKPQARLVLARIAEKSDNEFLVNRVRLAEKSLSAPAESHVFESSDRKAMGKFLSKR